MHLEPVDDETTYLEETETGFPAVAVDDGTYTVEPERLQPLNALKAHVQSADPDDVSSALGLERGQFDGEPIYHGSEPGTELQFQVHGAETAPALLLVSFGESQPGRYACKLEAILRP